MNQPKIRIKVKDMGDMIAVLYPEKAPETVKNYLALAESGFFDGLIFHRVIPGFMIQGGGYTPDFGEKKAKAIKGEFAANGFRGNDLRHKRGVLSMARTMDPNSASSQFFIMHADAPHLDRQYAAFGEVTDGIGIVDKIASVDTGRYGYFDDVPLTPVVIEKIEVL